MNTATLDRPFLSCEETTDAPLSELYAELFDEDLRQQALAINLIQGLIFTTWRDCRTESELSQLQRKYEPVTALYTEAQRAIYDAQADSLAMVLREKMARRVAQLNAGRLSA